jgi:Tol biopolymer transport system component
VIPAAGGLSRVLASNLGPVDNNGLAWSPDGQEIAFTTGGRIWRIARGGGEPSEIRIPLRGFLGQIDWSPEGNRLVFNFDSGEKTELWLMENFQLPE